VEKSPVNTTMATLDPYRQFIFDLFCRKHNDMSVVESDHIRACIDENIDRYHVQRLIFSLRAPLNKPQVPLDFINAHNASLKDFVFINHLHENYGLCDEDLVVAKKIMITNIGFSASKNNYLLNLGVKIFLHTIGIRIVDLEFVLENLCLDDIYFPVYQRYTDIEAYIISKTKMCCPEHLARLERVYPFYKKLIEVQGEIDCFWDFETKSAGRNVNLMVPQLRKILCRTGQKGSREDMNNEDNLSFNSGRTNFQTTVNDTTFPFDFFYVKQTRMYCSYIHKHYEKTVRFAPCHMSPVSLRFFLKKCRYLGGQDEGIELEPKFEEAPIISIEI
jgi:hypothetical protein